MLTEAIKPLGISVSGRLSRFGKVHSEAESDLAAEAGNRIYTILTQYWNTVV
jgi:hypothetical protein